jgi:lipoprotein-releasing system permease protein
MWLESMIALKFLRQGLAQTVLILVGISVGVAVIVFITTLILGLQENIIERTLGTQSHVRVEPPTERNLAAPPPQGTQALVLEDARAQRLRSITGCKCAIPWISCPISKPFPPLLRARPSCGEATS